MTTWVDVPSAAQVSVTKTNEPVQQVTETVIEEGTPLIPDQERLISELKGKKHCAALLTTRKLLDKLIQQQDEEGKAN